MSNPKKIWENNQFKGIVNNSKRIENYQIKQYKDKICNRNKRKFSIRSSINELIAKNKNQDDKNLVKEKVLLTHEKKKR